VGKAKKSREKPYKISMFAFIWPKIKHAKNEIVEWLEDMKLSIKSRFFGCWYCEHCDKIHGPRTVKYFDGDSAAWICSIGKNKMMLKANYRESDFNAYVGRTRL